MLQYISSLLQTISEWFSNIPVGVDLRFLTNLHFDNPLLLMFDIFVRGMFIPLLFILWRGAREIWLAQRQNLFAGINPYILLELQIPNMEVPPQKIEQLFNHVHGTLRSPTWWEIWWKGHFNLKLSFEIRAKDGQITYYIQCAHKHKHTVQEALHLHFPGAWLKEVPPNQDYVKNFPVTSLLHDEYQMLGTEYHLLKSHAYPLKTYRHYIDPLTGRFNDPLAPLLEMMSHLKPGEEIWFHLLIVPEFDNWQKAVEDEIEKIIGEKRAPKKKLPAFFLEPHEFFMETFRQIIGAEPREQVRQALLLGTEAPRQIFGLADPPLAEIPKTAPSASAQASVEVSGEFVSPGKIDVVKEMENKMRTPGFKAKIRIVYWGKNEVYSKFRFWSEIHGGLRNFNHYKLNILARGLRATTHANYAFARARKVYRQNRMLNNAKARDWYAGDKTMILNSEELASLWHTPSPKLISLNIRGIEKTKTVPPSTELRELEGFNPSLLLPSVRGNVPENLPVEQFKPFNYK